MIKSIRYFLLTSLLLSITIASAINGIGNYLLDEHVVQPFLDSQLKRVAVLIDILSQSSHNDTEIRQNILEDLYRIQPLNKPNFFFQVWGKNGNLIMESSTQLNVSLKDTQVGWSDQVFHGDDWRLYSIYDDKYQTKIVVAELYNLRRQLADDIAKSNAEILILTYFLFGILVWLIISLALRSVTRVTTEISSRASTFLEPVQLTEIPDEIKPLVGELNQLFIRLKLAFDRNKRFAADAAHELRTPLAALRTHAQVALKSDNELDRNKALQKVIESVDRSSHVVAQLLTLSRLGEEEALTDVKPLDLHKLATEIIAYLAPQAFEKNIDIELAPPPAYAIVFGNDTAIGILIRNVVDNAIRYTPPQGAVKIDILDYHNTVILRVSDTGTGIPVELHERVFERFYRILGTKASGSGLGLAIVSQIAKLHHAKIRLSTPENGIGLLFDVIFPKYDA